MCTLRGLLGAQNASTSSAVAFVGKPRSRTTTPPSWALLLINTPPFRAAPPLGESALAVAPSFWAGAARGCSRRV